MWCSVELLTAVILMQWCKQDGHVGGSAWQPSAWRGETCALQGCLFQEEGKSKLHLHVCGLPGVCCQSFTRQLYLKKKLIIRFCVKERVNSFLVTFSVFASFYESHWKWCEVCYFSPLLEIMSHNKSKAKGVGVCNSPFSSEWCASKTTVDAYVAQCNMMGGQMAWKHKLFCFIVSDAPNLILLFADSWKAKLNVLHRSLHCHRISQIKLLNNPLC